VPSVGASSPEGIRISISRSAGDSIDLRLVNEIEVYAQFPGAAPVLWTWDVESASRSSIVLTHTFAEDGSDAPVAGIAKVFGFLRTSTTRRRLGPIRIPFTNYP
jgi:hypothetical protein